MPTKYWIDAGDGDWANDAGWSLTSGGSGGAGQPTVNDDVIFDYAGDSDCNLSANATCNSLEVKSGYTSTLDFKSFDMNIATSCYLQHGAGGGMAWGSGTTTIGRWLLASTYAGSAWTHTGTIAFVGVGWAYVNTGGQPFHHVSVNFTTAYWYLTNDLTCTGNFTVEATNTNSIDLNGYDLTVTGDCTWGGSGSIYLGEGEITVGGDWDSTGFTGAWLEETADIVLDGSGAFDLGSAADTFGGTVTISGDYTLGADFSCAGFVGSSGDFDLNGHTITSSGNVDINGSSGFRFHNGIDYSMSDGKFDVDGGAVTLDGSQGDQIYVEDLDFDLATGVTGTANWAHVTNSVCTYVDSEFDATSHGNDDGSGNTGWDFEAKGEPGVQWRLKDTRPHWRLKDTRLHWRVAG